MQIHVRLTRIWPHFGSASLSVCSGPRTFLRELENCVENPEMVGTCFLKRVSLSVPLVLLEGPTKTSLPHTNGGWLPAVSRCFPSLSSKRHLPDGLISTQPHQTLLLRRKPRPLGATAGAALRAKMLLFRFMAAMTVYLRPAQLSKVQPQFTT